MCMYIKFGPFNILFSYGKTFARYFLVVINKLRMYCFIIDIFVAFVTRQPFGPKSYL